MNYRFSIDHPVRWGDIDAFGVLNNAVYLTIVEQARYAYFKHLELMRARDQFPFVLGEARIRFLKSGRSGMQLAVCARTERLGGKSLDMAYEVRHQQDVLAQAWATLVYVDEQGASIVIPDRDRSVLAAFEGLPDTAS